MKRKMKILIAYDGSELADLALKDLKRAGLPHGAEALVTSMADVWMWPEDAEITITSAIKAREEAKKAVEEARALALGASKRIQADFPGWEVHSEGCADTPAWGIIKRADEWKADLVVVGSHGRTALGRFFLGSVSQTVLTHARCSVRVARGRAQEDALPVRIMLGVDGSPGAEAAVSEVAERVWPSGTQVRVVAAINPLMVPALNWIEENYKDEREWVNKVVEAAAARLRSAGLAVSTLIKESDPKRLLVHEAEEWKADCIFAGARGLRAIERLLLGSVSAAVAARAQCSVEVVRRADK